MKNKFLLIVIILFNGLLSQSWTQYGEHLIEADGIVVKLSKEHAPMLGSESPINFQSKFGYLSFLIDEGAEDIFPLFYNFNNFSDQHYKFSLHQYYKVQFKDDIDYENISKSILKFIEIESVEPIYRK